MLLIRAICSVRPLARTTAGSRSDYALAWARAAGRLASYGPRDPERDRAIKRGYPKLIEDLKRHAAPLVLIKANVCRFLEPKLKEDGFDVLNKGRPVLLSDLVAPAQFRSAVSRSCRGNRLIRIAITPAAFETVCATLPLRQIRLMVRYPPEARNGRPAHLPTRVRRANYC
jgi:hypothetical protein